MAVNIWEAGRSPLLLELREGDFISIAVVSESGGGSLKWKREKVDHTWPPDAEAVTIATVTGSSFTAIQLLEDLSILIGDGYQFWRTMNTNPTQQSDFQVVNILP